jgi:hypothetical protein
LWPQLKAASHDGAYGSVNSGFYVLDDGHVVLVKIAIDIESIAGTMLIQDENETCFHTPYGIPVDVGTYPLSPYASQLDEFGHLDCEVFTKWRVQKHADLFGVHLLAGDGMRLAFIPSVVVQFSCPFDTPRHLNQERFGPGALWARGLVTMLRQAGYHARDVHSEHHGIVLLNATPESFSQDLSQSGGLLADIVKLTNGLF